MGFFRPFFADPVRLGNRTYRAWGENRTEKWKTKRLCANYPIFSVNSVNETEVPYLLEVESLTQPNLLLDL